MRVLATPAAVAICLCLASALLAQDDGQPLSVIDWFQQNQTHTETDTVVPSNEDMATGQSGIEKTHIETSVLPDPTPDSVGLTSSTVSGFAATIWENSESVRLEELLEGTPVPRLPALNILLTRLMVTEAEPPVGEPGAFLAARVRILTRLGEVEPAMALLDRAGPETSAELFKLWADLTLLTGQEDRFCEKINATPALSPGYDYAIYCLVRAGDWNGAATTLLAAEALGELDPDTVLLLTRYLDPELFEEMQATDVPEHSITPLTFRLYEGIGEPLPTDQLPLAYSHSDLRGLSGWRAQITAAERLARTGALSENRLLGLYTANEPSASGGVWDRVSAVQYLDKAIREEDKGAISAILPIAWDAMETEGLRFVIANLFSDDLGRYDWKGSEIESLVQEIGLLSRSYESVADAYWPTNHREAFLNAVATGKTTGTTYPGILPDAIRAGFSGKPSAEQTFLLARNADGEALLSAIMKVSGGIDAYPTDISHAISTFQVLGLGGIARQFALQLMLTSDLQ